LGRYDKTRGSRIAITGFMTWNGSSPIVALAGVELDAEMERRSPISRSSPYAVCGCGNPD